MTIAVTGGSGFIGSRLVDRLVMRGMDVRVLDIRRPAQSKRPVKFQAVDITNLDSTRKALMGIDTVYHLAGPVVQEVRKDTYRAITLQFTGTANVLEACVENRVDKVVYASSFYVYDGIDSRAVVNEETALDVLHMEAFGSVKVLGEKLVKDYSRKHNLKFVILRYGSAYGWGNCTNAVKEFLSAGLRGEALEVWGEGKRRNQYTFVEDLIEGTVSAQGRTNEVFNLISPESSSVRELAELLKSKYGFPAIYNHEMREGESMAYMVSRKAIQTLGWAPTPLERGVELTYQEATKA